MLSVLVELFGGSYYVTARNYLCKDKGKVPIEDIQDCKEAAKIIQDVRFFISSYVGLYTDSITLYTS